LKAFLLAGGRGERLRPLTLSVPKCLVPVNGAPLLGIWLDLLAGQGITDVLLNVSHHVDSVRAFLSARGGRAPGVHLVVEAEPMGSAGTVAANRWFVADEADFWVFYADNLTNARLAPMLASHQSHDGVLTMGLFHAPDPRAAGIAELDRAGRIVGFTEKPAQPAGDLANAGIYLARRAVLDLLPAPIGVVDFGLHVLPRLVGRMYGHIIEDFLMDIGTPASLERASNAWTRVRRTEPSR
jgi:mannose-1-phosphate guanylyltransferase